MANAIMLDTGPLGALAHPRANPVITRWLISKQNSGSEVLIPEIADYEVRRELIRQHLTRSVQRLDELHNLLIYAPIDTSIMLRAAELWATVRNMGRPTADPHSLDGDVILAAKAEHAGAVVATENVAHLGLFVEARDWRNL